MDKVNLLVNLPPGFFELPALAPVWERLRARAELRQRSWNTPEEIREDLAWAQSVIMWSWPTLSPELLASAPRLSFRGHIDLDQRAAKIALERQMATSLAKQGFSLAVAEMALTLALCLLRRVSDYHAQMRTGREKWVQAFPDDIDPCERRLTGRQVGIIGLGGVGRKLAALLAPFNCTISVFDPYLPKELAAQSGAALVDLKALIASSEVIFICAASNPGTNKLLGAAEIALFRPHAILVNVARAALIDMPALTARLKKGDFAAALDVFDKEPLETDSELRSLPNAYLTPHRAGGLVESLADILSWLADDFEAHLDGRPLNHSLLERMRPGLDA